MYQHILVPIDGSTTASKGLNEAIKLGKLTGARLRIIHVLDTTSFARVFEPHAIDAEQVTPVMRQVGEQLLEEARLHAAASSLTVEVLLLENVAQRVSDSVIAQAKAWPADLIVLGTHGRRGVRRLILGSDAEQIVRMAPIPVLLVRAPEFWGELAPAH